MQSIVQSIQLWTLYRFRGVATALEQISLYDLVTLVFPMQAVFPV
jgi:hypothetical protein